MCDGSAEADQRDAASAPANVPRVPPISLPEQHVDTVESRFLLRSSDATLVADSEREAERHDWHGELAETEPFFVVWNGPKLDWPRYLLVPDIAEHPSAEEVRQAWEEEGTLLDSPDFYSLDEAIAVDRRWCWGYNVWHESSESSMYGSSIFAQERSCDRSVSRSLPSWMLIRRTLQIMEARLETHGRQIWWRSVFHAPRGFAYESDSRQIVTNQALISHMRLAGLGERFVRQDRLAELQAELELVAGSPLERQRNNFHGWLGKRSDFWSSYLWLGRNTPWWCPQRNVWIARQSCSTCVLPPNFTLPCIMQPRGKSESGKRLENAILKALVDLSTRQGKLCKKHHQAVGANASYHGFVPACCRVSTRGSRKQWIDSTNFDDPDQSPPTSCCALSLWTMEKEEEIESWAFAAPGYCAEHWQVGRATMAVLGFRPVYGGTTIDGHKYAKWVQCGGQQARKEHLQARQTELRMHVSDPVFNPAGRSRVDMIAKHVLALPVLPSAALPEPASAPSTSHLSVNETCMECDS